MDENVTVSVHDARRPGHRFSRKPGWAFAGRTGALLRFPAFFPKVKFSSTTATSTTYAAVRRAVRQYVSLSGQLHKIAGEQVTGNTSTRFLPQFGPAGQGRQLCGMAAREHDFHRVGDRTSSGPPAPTGSAGFHRPMRSARRAAMNAVEAPAVRTPAPIRGISSLTRSAYPQT